ncbi:MAG: hypothetical protein AABX28_03380 [Nanoarchaeota archaeon]|mgnify:CR=1 FL=1
MVVIRGVSAREVFDSRKEKTIYVSVKTNNGIFFASAPNGKSKGKHEAKSYRQSLEEDIKTLKKFSDYFSAEKIEEFDDLRRIEDIVNGHIGANSLFALQSAVLKAMAEEQKKEIWELINPNAKKFPRLVGNCIGGGKHSQTGKKPDFQEFLLIPELNLSESFKMNKEIKKKLGFELKKTDDKFSGKKTDEDAWQTSLNEREILEKINNFKIPVGVDVASSSFYKRKNYHYENPMITRNKEEQLEYNSNLIRNFNLFYIEDPFNEEDFESFSTLLKNFPNKLIVGDDLTVTNPSRLKKAISMKSINAIIVKPNQIGSLIEMKEVCELAEKNNIKKVFSHRSGETEENILADLAFGFQADFFKSGITGKEREIKIKRLIEIEKSLR